MSPVERLRAEASGFRGYGIILFLLVLLGLRRNGGDDRGRVGSTGNAQRPNQKYVLYVHIGICICIYIYIYICIDLFIYVHTIPVRTALPQGCGVVRDSGPSIYSHHKHHHHHHHHQWLRVRVCLGMFPCLVCGVAWFRFKVCLGCLPSGSGLGLLGLRCGVVRGMHVLGGLAS